MAGTQFVERPDGGDDAREVVAENRGHEGPDFEAIDGELDRGCLDETADVAPELKSGEERSPSLPTVSVSNEQRSQIRPKLLEGEPQLLSESTDLESLMAAILGTEQDDRVPRKRAAPPGIFDLPKPAREAGTSWQEELETVLAEQRRRAGVATARASTLMTALTDSVTTGRFSALRQGWLMSRVSLLTVSVLAGMTLAVLGRQSGSDDRAPDVRPAVVSGDAAPLSKAVTHASEPRSGSALSSSGTQAATSGGAASSSIAGAATRPRSTPAPPAVSRPGPPATPTPPTTTPTLLAEPETAPEVARIAEPTPGTAPEPTANTPAATESTTELPTTAGPLVTPVDGVETGAAPPEPSAPAPAVAGHRTPARLLTRRVPEYPSALRAAKIGGTVGVTLTIDTLGRVRNVRSEGGNVRLRQAVEAAVQRWRYEPATSNGTPVESDVSVTFNFDPLSDR